MDHLTKDFIGIICDVANFYEISSTLVITHLSIIDFM